LNGSSRKGFQHLNNTKFHSQVEASAGNVELVWNKGIAALCDRRIPDEFPDGRSYLPVRTLAGAFASRRLPGNLISDPSTYRDMRDGEVVWVRLSWLRSFVKQVLPQVKASFVLVTGDSDSCVPSELMAEAEAILGSPNVLHWFTQNYDGSMVTEKMSPVPIGIDFHMLSERPIWGETSTSPLQQEQVLKSIGRGLAPVGNRIQKVYVDFAWQQGWSILDYRTYHPLQGTRLRQSRRWISRRLRANEAVHCQNGPVPRSEMWRRRGEFAFVLSPPGNGLDCHRTWEALALGHIVLVPSSSLNSLYSDLPVVFLNRWDEITSENLGKWLSLYKSRLGMTEKLRSAYWVNRMRLNAMGTRA
jgi:hypothetical protein